ncbi:predicted protein [Sclerotinia sclerotiorum 1980 UF-70]|uniref:Uncharacterized protein n=1 Tax=Sclerotinia sclerotiorum (strain ATCC 18683 / 1980 / Ss-1) TaxID=665079 RepID=A7E5I8_SCLS1|nr:predicted protein [Sclerotinia sclerotiorum 1980 UF-70]EDN91160.1 predicted protein [Sclerotinia sclerotiorum 1980 UF-70]
METAKEKLNTRNREHDNLGSYNLASSFMSLIICRWAHHFTIYQVVNQCRVAG